jgi:hypothetical protein
MNPNHRELNLLPNYVKKIAGGLLAVSVLIMVLSKLEVILFDKALLKMIIKNTILISFLLFALSKDKIEDERTMRMRSRAFGGAFIGGVTFAIVSPLISYMMSGGPVSDLGSTQLLLNMFIFYFIIYFLQKNQRYFLQKKQR